jgi:hypothetical protein
MTVAPRLALGHRTMAVVPVEKLLEGEERANPTDVQRNTEGRSPICAIVPGNKCSSAATDGEIRVGSSPTVRIFL